jgi:hypothetical protein
MSFLLARHGGKYLSSRTWGLGQEDLELLTRLRYTGNSCSPHTHPQKKLSTLQVDRQLLVNISDDRFQGYPTMPRYLWHSRRWARRLQSEIPGEAEVRCQSQPSLVGSHQLLTPLFLPLCHSHLNGFYNVFMVSRVLLPHPKSTF